MENKKPIAKVLNWSDGKLVPFQATTPMTADGWDKAGARTRIRMEKQRIIKEQWENNKFLNEAHEIKR